MSRTRLLWLSGGAVIAALIAAFQAVPLDWANERVQQAALAGLVVAAGWFASFLLREVSQQAGRAERLRDVHRALYAEIAHNLANLSSEGALEAERDAMLERIEGGDGFVPLIPRERHDTIFRSIVADIHVLPRTSVDAVVPYYSQLAALDAMIEDMRGEAFRALSQNRRAQMYRDYIAMKVTALAYGSHALEMIDAYAKGGRRRAEALRLRRAQETGGPRSDQ